MLQVHVVLDLYFIGDSKCSFGALSVQLSYCMSAFAISRKLLKKYIYDMLYTPYSTRPCCMIAISLYCTKLIILWSYRRVYYYWEGPRGATMSLKLETLYLCSNQQLTSCMQQFRGLSMAVLRQTGSVIGYCCRRPVVCDEWLINDVISSGLLVLFTAA